MHLMLKHHYHLPPPLRRAFTTKAHSWSLPALLRFPTTAIIHARHSSSSIDINNIPEIDFQHFSSNPAAQQDVVDQVRSACSRIGFMYVKNVHGLSEDLIKRCLAHTSRFFALPGRSKSQLRTSESNTRGYYKFTGSEVRDEDMMIEAFLMGNDLSHNLRQAYFSRPSLGAVDDSWKSLPVNQPNQWPLADEEGFRKTMLDYWNGCCIASAIILQALAMSLGLSQDYFTERHKKSDCSMELKRYPPPPHTPRQQFHTRLPPHLQGLRIPKSQSKPDTENNDTDPSLRNHHHHRFNEHSDLSSITLLIQTSSVDCLEVKNTNNQWIKARAHDGGSVLVNTGDVMERWTNGIYPSTRHRVVTNRDQTVDRYSVVFFSMPDWETDVGPIPALLLPSSLSPLQSTSSQQPVHLFGDLIPFA